MNHYSEFSAFIESVCAKVGCPDAAPYLQQGFRAYVEANEDPNARIPFEFVQERDSRNYIATVHSRDGWDLDSVQELASTIKETLVRDYGKYLDPNVSFIGSYSDDNGGSEFQIEIEPNYKTYAGVGKSNIKHCVWLAIAQFERNDDQFDNTDAPRPTVEALSDMYADDKEARSKLKTKLIRHTPNGDEIVNAVSRSMNQPEAIPERHTKFIGKAAEKPKWLTREDVEKAVDAEHPDWTNGKGSAYLHTFKPREDLIKERQVSQFDDANSQIARQNADRLSKAPFEQIKAMFPKAYCKIQAEVWVRKFLKTETDPNTKQKTVLGAVGSWEPHVDDEHYPNPTMAADAAKRKYRPGHWQVFTVIPELRTSIPNVISSDS